MRCCTKGGKLWLKRHLLGVSSWQELDLWWLIWPAREDVDHHGDEFLGMSVRDYVHEINWGVKSRTKCRQHRSMSWVPGHRRDKVGQILLYISLLLPGGAIVHQPQASAAVSSLPWYDRIYLHTANQNQLIPWTVLLGVCQCNEYKSEERADEGKFNLIRASCLHI